MERVPTLDWSQHLFATAPLPRRAEKPTDAMLCDCGCKQRHNCAVSAIEGNPGHYRVLWFASSQCKNRKMGVGHAT